MSKLNEAGLELKADVLVIGGGPAAAWAAIAAAEDGAKVVIADPSRQAPPEPKWFPPSPNCAIR